MFNSTKSVARLARKPIASCSFSNSSFRSNEPTASTSTAESTPPTETPTPEVKVEAEPVYDVGKNDKGFKAWLSGEGARYRKGVSGGTNWLGETPFPMNPTFSPLPPLHESIKVKIFDSYNHNISQKGSKDSVIVRAISSKFGIGMDRVRAVIRLKELEASWKAEKRPLQTELLKGMESHLGVKIPGENFKGIEPLKHASQRSSGKTVFEMIDVESGDSDAPVFLPLLARVRAAEAQKVLVEVKSKIVKATRPGRAATKFTDITGTEEGKKLEESRIQK